MAFASKLPTVGTTIFTVMSELARQHQAINLAQGFPGFPSDPELARLVNHYMEAGANQYAPMPGHLALREQISAKFQRDYHLSVDPATEITVTSGATEAIFDVVAALIRPGDEVMVFEPCFDCYAPAVALNGGTLVPIEMEPRTYAIDWGEVKRKITPRTRLILVNTPHNPAGTTLKDDDMRQLAALTDGTDIFVLSDEVYEHMVFDGGEHHSVLRYPELRERAFAVFSFGKTFHVTGWKVGYCVAPPALTAEFRKVHQYVTFSTHHPTQLALADYLKAPAHYQALPDFYQQKRDLFASLLADSPLELLPCEGSYFQLADYSTMTTQSDRELVKEWTQAFGVAAIPVSVFFTSGRDDKVIRFCFAKDEAELRQAAQRLAQIPVSS